MSLGFLSLLGLPLKKFKNPFLVMPKLLAAMEEYAHMLSATGLLNNLSHFGGSLEGHRDPYIKNFDLPVSTICKTLHQTSGIVIEVRSVTKANEPPPPGQQKVRGLGD